MFGQEPKSGESLVLRDGRLQKDRNPLDSRAATEMARAHELFRQGDYPAAEKIFHRIAENKKLGVQVAEEARFYEAECLRLQLKYPKAADTYVTMLNDFSTFSLSPYRPQAVKHLFNIANYWLDDTRDVIRQEREVAEGKRWFVVPAYFHWDKTKPLADEEGWALQTLEKVSLHDIDGKLGLGDYALFLMGYVKYHNQDYREADHYFSQLVMRHQNSRFAPKALELAIECKHKSTGGAAYDGRKCAEARKLIDIALRSYPELAAKKDESLRKQLVSIDKQQAEKDFQIAEFYRRTGHPGSAYFYYEIVLRRYPGVLPYCNLAARRKQELQAQLEKHPPPPPGKPPAIVPKEYMLVGWMRKAWDSLPSVPWKPRQASPGLPDHSMPSPSVQNPIPGSPTLER